jgi:GAF domain-containing protein
MTGRETAPLHLGHPSTLSRTLDATLHLGEQVELAVLLRLVIDEARSLCGARFGAIWVLDERRTMLSQFVCSGRRSGGGGEAIGRGGPPDGRPPATLAADPVLVRLVQLDLDDRSRRIGFRPAHPEATSFLRFPIKVHGLSSGCLYLTEKERSTEFTDDDETVVAVLAMAAGIAVENASQSQASAAALLARVGTTQSPTRVSKPATFRRPLPTLNKIAEALGVELVVGFVDLNDRPAG